MTRSIGDWVGNIAAFMLVIVINTLSNALPFNDQTQSEIAARYPSLFTPAGFTFSIWGVIYLALLVFVVYQALPSQRQNASIARLSVPFKINCVSNATWLFVWHHDMVFLSLLVMFVLLATLIVIYRGLYAEMDRATTAQHLALYLPFSLYTSWVTVATIANASVLQYAFGWDGLVFTSVGWTLLKLALAGAIAATMVIRYGDAVFVLVVAWAAYGISVMQSSTPSVSGAATSLALLSLLLAASEGVSRLAKDRRP
ncbi:MAG: tryptophan-rich sensory protein [Gammaproteobacteria bacterium]|nr:tryptophan-rich sensory protein [Gammaproteobacteria bacterium]